MAFIGQEKKTNFHCNGKFKGFENITRSAALETLKLVKCGKENLLAPKGMFDYVNFEKL